jgi:hypothetical protein
MFDPLQSLFSLIAVAASIANIVWTWISKGHAASAEKAKSIEENVDRLEMRVLQLEGEFKHLPSKHDISELRLQLENVLGKISRQESEISNVNRTVIRIDDYLREKA